MLTSTVLTELERCASSLDSDNHHRFLSEALACLRQSRDPVAVYVLLKQLQAIARKDEDAALSAVRTWLDAQLSDPAVRSVDDLLLRIAWTRRIARIVKAQNKGKRPADPPSVRPSPRDIPELRKKYPLPPAEPPRPLPPLFRPFSASAPVLPPMPPLPDELDVLFANHREAVKSLKRASKLLASAQHGPPRSASNVPLAVTDKPLPAGLDDVTLLLTSETVGLAAYLKELNGPRNGAAFPFRVARLERQGPRVVAHEILLSTSDKQPARS